MTNDDHSADGQNVPTSSTTESLGTLALRTRSTFVIPPGEAQLFLSLTEALTRTTAPFQELGRALQANIAGLISTVTVPYTLAIRSVHDRHWQRIYSAERIRALTILDPNENETGEGLKVREAREDREAIEAARSKME